jgi:hypothetical protein
MAIGDTSGKINYAPVVAPQGQPCALPTGDSYDWYTQHLM